MNEESIIDILYEKFVGMGLGTHIPNGNSLGQWSQEIKRLMWAELNSPSKNSVVIGSHNMGAELALGIVKDYKNDKSEIISVDIQFGDYYDLNQARLKGKFGIETVKWEMNSDQFMDTYNLYTNESIGLVFIDGYHKYSSIILDFCQVKDFLVKDSIVAFHDCCPNFPKRGTHKLPVENIGKDEDFLCSEALSAILEVNPEYNEIDLKLGMDCYYPERTGLKTWVRGTTSSFNSLFLIQHG